MAVRWLGNPCQTDKIKQIADKREINLIEDCCEAHGAKIGNKSVGSFGICSTFSFFLSHHITTIEGGMVLTNNNAILDIATAQRAHGWIREMRNADEIAKEFPDIDRLVNEEYIHVVKQIFESGFLNKLIELELFPKTWIVDDIKISGYKNKSC